MKKTINIAIGGISFQIEEDAYDALDSYLKAIKQRFAEYPDAAEIISDMEDRIAEQFSNKIQSDKTITMGLVQELIAVMGRPEQLSEDKTEIPHENRASFVSNKRLYRNPDDVIVAGVCSGIAEYIGSDPVWVRLVFFITIFFGGFGILLYIILWIILPEAQTDTEKMRMRGEPVNLKNLESTVKERISDLKKKDKSTIKKIFAAPFIILGQVLQAFGRVVKKLFPFFVKLIGLAITIFASCGLAAMAFVLIGLLFNINSPYIDFPLRELAHGAIYYTTLFSGFLVFFVPIIFTVLLGTSLVALRPTVKKIGGFSLLGLWVLSLIVFINAGIKLAPQVESVTKSSPYFNVTNKQFDVKDFTAIELSGADELTIYPGDSFKVTATGTEKDMENVGVVVENGVLKLSHQRNEKICIFCSIKSVKYAVYAPEINNLSISGAGSVVADNLNAQKLNLSLSDSSKATITAYSKQVLAKLTGSSRVKLKGVMDSVNIDGSGVSSIKATEAKITNAFLNLSGSNDAYFGSLDKLVVKASGSSRVWYQSVKDLTQNLSGASSVKQKSTITNNEDDYSYQPELDKQYVNQAYNFKFNYLQGDSIITSISISTSTDSGYYLPIETYFYQNKAGETLITAALPKDSFPEYTDFQNGFFSVSILKKSTQAQCLKFGNAAKPDSQKLTINNIPFTVAEASGAGMSHQAYDKIYHTYQNGNCFEMITGVRTGGFGASDTITEQVNTDEVFFKLEPMLQSFEFIK